MYITNKNLSLPSKKKKKEKKTNKKFKQNNKSCIVLKHRTKDNDFSRLKHACGINL